MRAESWLSLTDPAHAAFHAGTVFRLPARFPFEAIADFMLICDNSTAVPELRIVTITGRKAGFINLVSVFPTAAYIPGSVAICPVWLKTNWKECVYSDCEVHDVYVTQGYATPSQLPR